MSGSALPAVLALLLGAGTVLAAAPDTASPGGRAEPTTAAPAIHATGIVREVDAARGRVVVQHEAIAAVGWPAMTMGFRVADARVLASLAPGKKVRFAFVQQGRDYVITALE